MGTTTLEDVAASSGDASRHMFQLYVIKDRDFTQQLVQVQHFCDLIPEAHTPIFKPIALRQFGCSFVCKDPAFSRHTSGIAHVVILQSYGVGPTCNSKELLCCCRA